MLGSTGAGRLILLPVLLISKLFCISNMAAKRQRELWRGTQNPTSKRPSKQGRTCLAFDDVALEVTECNFCFNLSVTAVTGLLTRGRGGKVSRNFYSGFGYFTVIKILAPITTIYDAQ